MRLGVTAAGEVMQNQQTTAFAYCLAAGMVFLIFHRKD